MSPSRLVMQHHLLNTSPYVCTALAFVLVIVVNNDEVSIVIIQ